MVVVKSPVTCVLCQEVTKCVRVDKCEYICGDCVQKVLDDHE